MFIRRQDLIDTFTNNFRDAPDGGIVYQPADWAVPVPVTVEEYEQVVAAFERRQMMGMAITWLLLAAAGAHGLYKLIAEGRFLPMFIGIAAAAFLSFLFALRDNLGLLMPFIARREALEEEADPAAVEQASRSEPGAAPLP